MQTHLALNHIRQTVTGASQSIQLASFQWNGQAFEAEETGSF